jgi:hypothetical protein
MWALKLSRRRTRIEQEQEEIEYRLHSNRLMAGGRCSSHHALKIFRVLLVLEIMTAVGLVPDDVVSLTGRFRLVLAQGSWEVLVQNAGISSMHTAVTHFGNVVLLDRTNIGPSQLPLNGGRCRANPADRVSTKDIFPLACCDHRFFCFFGSQRFSIMFIQPSICSHNHLTTRLRLKH